MEQEDRKVYEGVYDSFTITAIQALYSKNYIDHLTDYRQEGKEALVTTAAYKNELRALKIYRLTSAYFLKLKQYLQLDPRFQKRMPLRKAILTWVEKEFRNLRLAHKAGLHVPYPITKERNIIVMEFLEGEQLKNSELKNPKQTYLHIKEQLLQLLHAGLVHADISEYNIMMVNHIPYIIDFGQAFCITDTNKATVWFYLERDLTSLLQFFTKFLTLDTDKEKQEFKVALDKLHT